MGNIYFHMMFCGIDPEVLLDLIRLNLTELASCNISSAKVPSMLLQHSIKFNSFLNVDWQKLYLS